jgi:hypothetical protein
VLDFVESASHVQQINSLQRRDLVEPTLPIRRDATSRSGRGLIDRVMLGIRQRRAFVELLGGVIPKPILPWLKAPDHAVASFLGVLGGVLVRRGVATADRATLGAASEMKPPRVDL